MRLRIAVLSGSVCLSNLPHRIRNRTRIRLGEAAFCSRPSRDAENTGRNDQANDKHRWNKVRPVSHQDSVPDRISAIKQSLRHRKHRSCQDDRKAKYNPRCLVVHRCFSWSDSAEAAVESHCNASPQTKRKPGLPKQTGCTLSQRVCVRFAGQRT